jgi:DNA-binding NtrC family response regulator
MRVLLVDDDPIGLDLRRMVLEASGHQVTTAKDGESARACLAAAPEALIEAVIMDLRMPRPEDGLALLRELHETVPGARVVVFSGFTGDLEGHAERAFASEILSKPARTERLLDALAAR